jgi:hypothetical protein
MFIEMPHDNRAGYSIRGPKGHCWPFQVASSVATDGTT